VLRARVPGVWLFFIFALCEQMGSLYPVEVIVMV
jgi:hypothetical protein